MLADLVKKLESKGTAKPKVQRTLNVVRSPRKDADEDSPKAGPSAEGEKEAETEAVRLVDAPDAEAAAKDDAFRTFRKLCAMIAEENSYNGKTKIVSEFLQHGSSGGACQLLH